MASGLPRNPNAAIGPAPSTAVQNSSTTGVDLRAAITFAWPKTFFNPSGFANITFKNKKKKKA